MALSNRERVRKGLDELKVGLVPFVERELKSKLGAGTDPIGGAQADSRSERAHRRHARIRRVDGRMSRCLARGARRS